MVWTRDGFLLDNTGPLVLVDDSTFSYTNVLMVSGRTPGTYTCQIRGTNDQILSFANFSVQGITLKQVCYPEIEYNFHFSLASAPPVNVQATQSSSTAPVELSWSPPSDGATNITGYRIFYGNGQSVLVPAYVTRVMLNFVELSQIESVSIRSESMQLPSELISVTVTIAGEVINVSYNDIPYACHD